MVKPALLNKQLFFMVSTIFKYEMETHLDFSIPKAKTSLSSGVIGFFFFWLFTSILGYVVMPFLMLTHLEFEPAIVVLASKLPNGYSLSSSAALSLCCILCSSSCLLKLRERGCETTRVVDLGGCELKLLHKWAFEGEKLIHGKPSVTANTVSTYRR